MAKQVGKLKNKQVKGRVKILKAILYKGHMTYVRMIGSDYFEYLVVFDDQIYSGYAIITPKEGKKKLSKAEIGECMAIVYAGAEATIDQLLGVEVDENTKKLVEEFEKTGDKLIEDEQDA